MCRRVAQDDPGCKRMSTATERFDKFLPLSDRMLARAKRDDSEECARVPAEQCAPHRSRIEGDTDAGRPGHAFCLPAPPLQAKRTKHERHRPRTESSVFRYQPADCLPRT